MKKYTIKPEYIDLWGEDADEETIVTEDDVMRLAIEWERTPDELKSQLYELDEYFIITEQGRRNETFGSLWDAIDWAKLNIPRNTIWEIRDQSDNIIYGGINDKH